jgi:hypothetical protein
VLELNQMKWKLQLQTQVDTPALETLYTYTTDSNDVQSRPLGELPTLEI